MGRRLMLLSSKSRRGDTGVVQLALGLCLVGVVAMAKKSGAQSRVSYRLAGE